MAVICRMLKAPSLNPGTYISLSPIKIWPINPHLSSLNQFSLINFCHSIFAAYFFPHLGLVLSTKIQVLRNFLTKIWEFWTPKFFQKIWEIFRQNILMQLAGQIFENFSQNILIGTQIENLRKLSEFWEFCQNSDNFFVEPMFYAIKIYATKILPLKKLSVTFLQLRQCE